MNIEKSELIIVGCGFFGATIAECAASHGYRVLLLDKRKHIGGNSYSEIDPDTGVEVHRYGSHIFHTNSDAVWNYLHQFTTFNEYRHRVWTTARGRVYAMPINLGTICAAYGRALRPIEARDLIATEIAGENVLESNSLEGKAVSSIGRTLYELLVRGYTHKQWQTNPKDLPADIIGRLPVRFDFNDRYFSDRYEGIPTDGYTEIFQKMLSHKNIRVELGIDYFDIAEHILPSQLLIYTGPIDRFYRYEFGRLGWRTSDFVREVHSVPDFQGAAVMNYADVDVPHTRIHEFRHLHPERSHPMKKTTIFKEYSRFAEADDEPYYPINTPNDRAIFDTYKERSVGEPNTIFGGRLGTYKYLDMHQAIGAALKIFEDLVQPFFREWERVLRV